MTICERFHHSCQLATRPIHSSGRTFDQSELPMPAGVLARVLHALSRRASYSETASRHGCIVEDLVLQRILTPQLCADEVFYEAFAAVLDRMSGLGDCQR